MEGDAGIGGGKMAHEVHRLSSLVNELTLRCVLSGVDLPRELCPQPGMLAPPTFLDRRFETFMPWSQPSLTVQDQRKGALCMRIVCRFSNCLVRLESLNQEPTPDDHDIARVQASTIRASNRLWTIWMSRTVCRI